MTRRLIIGSACLATLVACVSPTMSASDLDIAAIRATHDAWMAAYTAGELSGLEQFYSADTVLMPAGRPTFRGWNEIESYFAPGFNKQTYTVNAEIDRISASGRLGVVEGTVSVRYVSKAGGTPGAVRLRYLTVFRREPTGQWRVVSGMDNAAP